MPDWKRNNWVRDDGHAGENLADFRELDLATHWIRVKWEFISAHSGVHGSECAHRLAKEGADKYKVALNACLTRNNNNSQEKWKRENSQDENIWIIKYKKW